MKHPSERVRWARSTAPTTRASSGAQPVRGVEIEGFELPRPGLCLSSTVDRAEQGAYIRRLSGAHQPPQCVSMTGSVEDVERGLELSLDSGRRAAFEPGRAVDHPPPATTLTGAGQQDERLVASQPPLQEKTFDAAVPEGVALHLQDFEGQLQSLAEPATEA